MEEFWSRWICGVQIIRFIIDLVIDNIIRLIRKFEVLAELEIYLLIKHDIDLSVKHIVDFVDNQVHNFLHSYSQLLVDYLLDGAVNVLLLL